MIARIRSCIFFCCIVAVLVCAMGVNWMPANVHASVGYDFGGRVIFWFPCVNGLWVIISHPKPASLFYLPGFSAIKLWGPPKSVGHSVLGTATGYAACLMPCHAGLCPVGWGMVVMPNAGSNLIPS